ncbi:MAG: RluA family pseudouridine synthase [Acidobacteria bacterium]|nr:RluA family pseudouridine synthase [Acidobacteriota bacterium]
MGAEDSPSGIKRFRVEDVWAGRRLDEFLAERLTAVSRMHIAGLLARGACRVGGGAAHAGRRLCAGELVEVESEGFVPNSMTPEPLPLEVVYEDEHVIVVVKPSGVLVHPTLGVKRGTLANALAFHLNRLRIERQEGETERRGDGEEDVFHQTSPRPPVPPSLRPDNPQWIRPGIVHRLDRDTSGLMVVAKNQGALSRLTQHFQRRLVEKRYVAVVGGLLEEDELTVGAPIGRVEGARPPWRVLESGKPAETRLRVVERGARRTLVELEPLTGRTNQLRIHCAHLGHAVAGDVLYSGEPHARLCLHAARLAFRHPATNEWVEFASGAPPELLSALV